MITPWRRAGNTVINTGKLLLDGMRLELIQLSSSTSTTCHCLFTSLSLVFLIVQKQVCECGLLVTKLARMETVSEGRRRRCDSNEHTLAALFNNSDRPVSFSLLQLWLGNHTCTILARNRIRIPPVTMASFLLGITLVFQYFINKSSWHVQIGHLMFGLKSPTWVSLGGEGEK